MAKTFAVVKVSAEPNNGSKIVLEDVQVPQYSEDEDGLLEFQTEAGDVQKAVAFVNKALANVAAQRARNYINSADAKGDTPEAVAKLVADIITKARELAKTTVPTDRSRSGAGVKDRAEAGATLAAKILRGEQLSDEEKAHYARMFGVTL